MRFSAGVGVDIHAQRLAASVRVGIQIQRSDTRSDIQRPRGDMNGLSRAPADINLRAQRHHADIGIYIRSNA